jgi:hypothetical protein
MTSQKMIGALIILGFVGLSAAVPAEAQTAKTSEGWTFQLMPYFWASGIKSDIQAPIGPERTIDLSFSDILESIHFGAMGSFEGRKGRWGFLFDGGYADIRKTVSVSGDVIGDVEAKMPTSTVALVATGRVVQGKMVLELLAGPRYNWSKTELTVTSGLAAGLQYSSTDSWWDAIAGARLFIPLAKSWMLYGYGDVGGGGSELTWQAKGAVAWRFSRVLSAEVGYRHFYFERVNNGVSNKQAKSGVYLGLGIWF